MNNTVWVNVTTLMNWARPAVGVVRVEQEYIRWLLSGHMKDPHVKFVVFHQKQGKFFEVDQDAVVSRLFTEFVIDEALAPTAEQRLKELAKKFSFLIPSGFIPLAREIALRLIRFGRRVKSTFLRFRYRGKVPSRLETIGSFYIDPNQASVAKFQAGDCFISMGLDWDQLNLQTLYALKKAYQLRVVLMCYDTIPALFPHLVIADSGRFGEYLVELAWCADHVLCISKATQNDFLAFVQQMGAPLPATSVIRLGDELPVLGGENGDPISPRVLRASKRPFVLYVSTIERRKNHEMLYRTWVRLRERGVPTPKLIFVGMQGWGVDDFLTDIRLDPRVDGDIELLHHVSDRELGWLYERALFTVYPSLYEGWGLPVTESLARGKFCLCSCAASIPEAGGSLCEYLDPWDLPAWVNRVEHLLRRPEELALLHERVTKEFVPTPWATTADQIHQWVKASR